LKRCVAAYEKDLGGVVLRPKNKPRYCFKTLTWSEWASKEVQTGRGALRHGKGRNE